MVFKKLRVKRFFKMLAPAIIKSIKMASQADSLTYYPQKARKGRLRIFFDLLYWFLRYQEVNQYYYNYGFDCLGSSDKGNYGGIINQRDLRNFLNRRFVRGKENTSYVVLAADKFISGMYLEALGFPTPRVLALLDRNGIRYREDLQSQKPLDSLLRHSRLKAVCKSILGGSGKEIIMIDVQGGRLLLGGNEVSIVDFSKMLHGIYILQDRVVQHPKLNQISPSAVMTLRLVTIIKNGHSQMLAGVVRVGIHGATVDNWHAGGMVGHIDLDTGRIGKAFQFRPGHGGLCTKHPDTGVKFEGFQLPFAQDAVNISLAAHNFFYGIHSLGWDIAFTEDGPTILEVNDEWMMPLLMVANGGLKGRFLELCPEGTKE